MFGWSGTKKKGDRKQFCHVHIWAEFIKFHDVTRLTPSLNSAPSWQDWRNAVALWTTTVAKIIISNWSCIYWFRKYSTITSLEQRQKYKEDFCGEYDEYRALHDRIGAITEMFVQLGSKINTLSPGTQEYKVLTLAKYFQLSSL